MRVDLTPDQESQAVKIAAQAGRNADEVVGEMFERFLTEEARFIAAVELGEAELDRGDFLTHEEVGARVTMRRVGWVERSETHRPD